VADERLIFDPAEKIENRTELDITPWVDQNGVDWGEAVQVPTRAKGERGETVVASEWENRLITAGCVLQDKGGTAFATIRSYLQAKMALYQREGGVIKRITPQGGTVYGDIVASGLKLSGGWLQAHRNADNEAGFSLEALPDFYEPEVELTSAEEKTATELIKVIPDPGGDMPARVRIEVTEKQGVDQKALIWAFRSRYYSPALTAKTAYEAEELQALDAARKVALAGASGGTVVQHGTVSTAWTSIVGGRIGGTAFPTQRGSNRLFARAYSTSGTLVRTRAVWDVGDLTNPTENAAVRLPGASNFYILDLGEVRLDAAPVGAHRWDWQIQAAGDVGKEDFKVDKVWIVNTDEGMGTLTAPVSFSGPGLSTFSARDEFNQTAGTLTGKVLSVGGTWVGVGATGDFNVSGGVITRATEKDAGKRFALAGTAEPSQITVQADFEASALANQLWHGVVARYQSTTSYVAAELWYNTTGPVVRIWIENGGIPVEPFGQALMPLSPNTRYRLAIVVSQNTATAFFGPAGAALSRVASATSTLIPAFGRIGITDYFIGSPSITRTIDNFAAYVNPLDAVLFASQKAQLTTDGMYRLDSGGSAYGPVSRVLGDLPRLPAGGLENRTTELFLKGSRGDLGELPDTAIDDIAVKVYASRSWLTVPGTI
jgi:hypothetical protein